VAAQGIGRVFLGEGVVRGDGMPDNPCIFQTDIDLAALGLDCRKVASLTFNQASGADTTGIFAVSGTPAAVPEPTTLAFLGLSLVGVLMRRR
jgi:hypothetical protein